MQRWYVVHTKPRMEAEAEVHLGRQGFTTYLPWITQSKRRRGRWVRVTEPLFPRYLFLQVDPEAQDISPIRSTRGVSGLVRFGGGTPTPVPDEVITAIRAMEDPEEGTCRLENGFQPGQEVVVLEGPLAGLHGIYHAASGEQRAIILIEMLGRLRHVKLDTNAIDKTTQP